MRRVFATVLILLLPFVTENEPTLAADAHSLVKHELKVVFHPDEHRFTAEDTISVPQGSRRTLHFSVHKGLAPASRTPEVTVVRESEKQGSVPVEYYRVSLPAEVRTFILTFGGEVFHPVSPPGQEIAGGMRDTPGIISGEGVFLSGASRWYPVFEDTLLTFTLQATVPRDWDLVSQGERISHQVVGDVKEVTWRCEHPQEEIFAVAAPFFGFSRKAGDTELMVFLREDDKVLADKYLTAAARYLPMYERMIGPYAYGKLALVENFWETGYGMPSFALMGPKVIRFPFIVDSSYPHEILHNWWGNGVFPAPGKGNWTEGLTAYLSDYLIQEQRGAARQYRRDLLQKYADYVSKQKDFPLIEFRSRHSEATQAIGYGKALMLFHMLRTELGDDAFRDALRKFYADNKFAYASFNDLRKSFEAVSGKDLRSEFRQWIERPGAPQLKIRKVSVKKEGDGYLASVCLEQPQAGAPYRLNVPVAITMAGQEQAYQTTVHMTQRVQRAEWRLPHMPLRIDVDPEFDLFRRLAQEEIPPALSQIFGAEKLTIVLPSSTSDTLVKAFGELAQAWRESGPNQVTAVDDADMASFPPDASIVILGWDNRFLDRVLPYLELYGVKKEGDFLEIEGHRVPRKDRSLVLTYRHPKNRKLAVAWVGSDAADAIRALARKIPHYNNYSYLVFDGDKAQNSLKGYWPVPRSPMTAFFPGADGSLRDAPMGKLVPRKPLTTIP